MELNQAREMLAKAKAEQQLLQQHVSSPRSVWVASRASR